MPDDGGRDGAVGGTDGGRKKRRADRLYDEGDQPFCELFIPQNPEKPSRAGVYFHEYHRKSAGAWLGGDSGGVKGDGEAAGIERGGMCEKPGGAGTGKISGGGTAGRGRTELGGELEESGGL